MTQPHAYFEPIVGAQRAKNRLAAIIMLVLCGIAAGWAFSQDFATHPDARMAAVAVVGLPVALFVLVWNLLPHRGLAALAEPSRIVWYYGAAKGGQVNAVMVGFDNGKLHRFPLPLISLKEGFSQEAFQHLRAAAPGAATGFSEELRQAFRAKPASLRS